MADVIKLVGAGIVVALLLRFLKGYAPSLAAQAAIAFGVLATLWLIRPMGYVITTLADLAADLGVQNVYITTVFKAVGIAAVTTIGADMCRDAGEDAIANTVELAGNVFVLLLSLPIVAAIMDVIGALLR